jgi:hypothetical protein
MASPVPAFGRTASLSGRVIRIRNPSFCSLPDHRRSAANAKQAKKDEHDLCDTERGSIYRTARKRPQFGQ